MKEPKRGDRVLVWQDKESCADERIYLCTIEGAKYPIQVVSERFEDAFKNGQPFAVADFKHMKPIAPELTVGKWYKTTVGSIYFFTSQSGNYYGGYGVDCMARSWVNLDVLCSAKYVDREATEQEVEEALKAEAKRRGYKEGNFYCLDDGGRCGFTFRVKNNEGFCYYPVHNQLTLNCGALFNNGKWTKIVEQQNEYTVEELEKLTGIENLKIKK